MKFRRSTLCDMDRILEILADGKKTLSLQGVDQWQGQYPQRSIIESDIISHESYVVEESKGILIATTMIGLSGEDDYSYIEGGAWLTQASATEVPYAVIHRMAVDSRFRGCGASDLVVSEAERHAASVGKSSIRIDTHPENMPMIRLLEKHGYTRCGTIYIDHAEKSDPTRVAFEKIVTESLRVSEQASDIACA